jgi:hypothetical protein
MRRRHLTRPAGRSSGLSIQDAVIAKARECLTLRGNTGAPDLWLLEHSQRVMELSRLLALLPEIGEDRPHRQAVMVAALFHDAGWAVQVQQGQVQVWQVVNRPTNDLQRELGAGLLLEACAKLLPEDTLELAAEAIRQCNDRYTALPEAQVLAEADNLDEIGLPYVLRQFRQSQFEGRPLEQLLINWARQLEYRYWDARINDCLRFETTRHLARRRLEAVEAFMATLARDREAGDVWRALKDAGIDTSAAGDGL